MQLVGTLVLAGLATMPNGREVTVLFAAASVLNLIAATQDVASDGLAVELLPPEERGIANGLQVGAYRVGMIVGGGVLLEVGATIGFRGQLGIMATLAAIASLPVPLSPEPATTTAERRVSSEHSHQPHFLQLPGV